MSKKAGGKPRKQIAALPVARGADGGLRVLVITSRENRRFIVPKGWPMRGVADHKAAAIEASEEAGILGRARSKPIGSYLAWKRMDASFLLVKVKVYLLDVTGHLDTWKEKGQRSIAWMKPDDAALIVDEQGLAQILHTLPSRLPRSWRTKAADTTSIDELGIHPVVEV